MNFRFTYIIAQPRDRKCDFCTASDRAHLAEENGILQARIAGGIAKIQGVGGNCDGFHFLFYFILQVFFRK
jgi:hypothetical protein